MANKWRAVLGVGCVAALVACSEEAEVKPASRVDAVLAPSQKVAPKAEAVPETAAPAVEAKAEQNDQDEAAAELSESHASFHRALEQARREISPENAAQKLEELERAISRE